VTGAGAGRPARPRRITRGALRRLEVFAIEDDAVQLTWASLGGPEAQVEVSVTGGDAGPIALVEVGGTARPGALSIGGLPPDTALAVVVRPTGAEPVRLATRTLPPPPGRRRARVATISDIHLGERAFGHLPRIKDTGEAGEPAAARCARAALAEAVEWGAELVVVKGDLTLDCRPEELEAVAELLGGCPVPTVVMPGNHDGGNHRPADPSDPAGDPGHVLARHGIELVTDIEVRDLPGVRVVACNTVVPGRGHGRIGARLPAVLDALDGAETGVLLCLHHHPQRTIVPTHWPPGILGIDGHRFLDGVERANPATLVTAGHTHRHRRRRHGPVTVTEVGSPKDYPGTWAGYVSHDGGIRQVVRRVAHPSAIAWTERTRAMGLGQWGRWAPGHIDARCFSLAWSQRR
jgi:3',5'-cyclic AMP phosphodiesterase CpdA